MPNPMGLPEAGQEENLSNSHASVFAPRPAVVALSLAVAPLSPDARREVLHDQEEEGSRKAVGKGDIENLSQSSVSGLLNYGV